MDNKIFYYIDEMGRLMDKEYVHPVTVEVDPTNKCNAKCGFCMFTKYRQENLETLDIEIYEEVIQELSEKGTKSVTFTGGGEPTLHPRFNDMCYIALDWGMEIGLVTNGILLDKVSFIKEFTFVRVSLDAHDPETYQKVKGVDQFAKVVDNIKCASYDIGSGTLGISYVINEDNKHGIEGANYLAEDLGADYIQFKPAYINGQVFTNFIMPNVDPDIGINTQRHKAINNMPCDVAHLVGIVGADANVYYCCQHRGKPEFCLGSLKGNSFEHLWRRRMEMRPDVSKCPSCRYLNYSNAYERMMHDRFFQHRRFL